MKHMTQVFDKPIKISQPVVVIPAKEYEILLKEAGYIKTPILEQEIHMARKRFARKQTIPWETLKNELR